MGGMLEVTRSEGKHGKSSAACSPYLFHFYKIVCSVTSRFRWTSDRSQSLLTLITGPAESSYPHTPRKRPLVGQNTSTGALKPIARGSEFCCCVAYVLPRHTARSPPARGSLGCCVKAMIDSWQRRHTACVARRRVGNQTRRSHSAQDEYISRCSQLQPRESFAHPPYCPCRLWNALFPLCRPLGS